MKFLRGGCDFLRPAVHQIETVAWTRQLGIKMAIKAEAISNVKPLLDPPLGYWSSTAAVGHCASPPPGKKRAYM